MGDSSCTPSPVVTIPNGTVEFGGWRRASQSGTVTDPPATPPGPTSPTATGTTGAGSRRTPSATPGSSSTCSPSRAEERQRPRSPAGPVQARDPALLLLADRPLRPARPDPAPVGPLAAGAGRRRRDRRRGRPARRGQGFARPRPDPPLPRPRPARHDPRLHDVLPVLHAQARHDEARRLGLGLARRPPDGRVRPRPPRDPRRDRLRRRPAHPPAREARVLRREPRPRSRTST